MKIEIANAGKKDAVRLVSIGGHQAKDENILLNGGPGQYESRLFAIHEPFGNFSRCVGILWSAGDHEVLDVACDAGLLDHLKIEESEIEDEDGICRLGNASEAFDIDNISIQEISPETWQADWEFVFQLGRASEVGLQNLGEI